MKRLGWLLKKNANRIVGGYEKARRVLIPESRDWCDKHVADEEHPATAEGLAEFIRDLLEPICYRMVKEAQFAPAIKANRIPLKLAETSAGRGFWPGWSKTTPLICQMI